MESEPLEDYVFPEMEYEFSLKTPSKHWQFNFPKRWQEIEMKHRILYAGYLWQYETAYALTQIALHWFHEKGIPKKILLNEQVFTLEQWFGCTARFRCLCFTGNATDDTPLFESFVANGTTYQLLSPRFTNGMVREYRKADDLYNRIVKGEDRYLELMACLCRPVVNGIALPLQSDTDVLSRKKDFEALKQNILPYQYATVHYYKAIRQFIYEKWGGVLFASPTENTTAQPENNLGWWNLIYAAAENITKVNEVENQNFHQFCAWWYKKKLDDDAYKRAMEGNGLKTD